MKMFDAIEWPTTSGALAASLGCNPATINRAITDGRLKAVQPGGRGTQYIISRPAVEAAVASGRLRGSRRGRGAGAQGAPDEG